MLFSLSCAEPWLSAEDCIVAYSDIVYHPEVIELMNDCRDDIAIPYNTDWLRLWQNRFADPLEDAETFRKNKDGILTEIGDLLAPWMTLKDNSWACLSLPRRAGLS